MLVLHGLNEGFIPLYHPAPIPSMHGHCGSFNWELSIDWLIVRLLFCAALSPEHNLSPEQHRSAAPDIVTL